MSHATFTPYHHKVVSCCEAVLQREGSVGLIDLCQQMGFLHFTHINDWKHGKPQATPLHQKLKVGAEKLSKVISTLESWAHENNMSPLQVPYERLGRNGAEPLPILLFDDPELDAIWRRHWIPAGLTTHKAEKLAQKLTRPEDLVVFVPTIHQQICQECAAEIVRSEFFFLEHNQPLCLNCADLDHLEFLPAGNATLTRRARKFSPLVAEVLQLNGRRKRYDRIGLLVATAAIDQAEASLQDDASERAMLRQKSAAARAKADEKLVVEMSALILANFPSCPPDEAHAIAAHTAVRGSGRVGRSEAGRHLDAQAIELAVIAWIRHQHTNYDQLLMSGVGRQDARGQIRSTVQRQLQSWRSTETHSMTNRPRERPRTEAETPQVD